MNAAISEPEVYELLDFIARLAGERDTLLARKNKIASDIKSLQDDLDRYATVLDLLREFMTELPERFIRYIESLVTDALVYIFDEPLQFKLEYTTRNKNPNLNFSIINGDGAETEVKDSRGGGLVCYVGVILRIILLRLMRAKIRQIMFLDEPLGMLSEEYQEKALSVIRELSHRFNIQIVMVSHQMEAREMADTVYSLSRDQGKVKAELIYSGGM